MRQDFTESGYVIKRQVAATITNAESHVDTKGETFYIQNVGANIVYMDAVTGVDNTKWQVAVGERSGPWTARVGADTNLYLLGAGNSTLNFIFLRDV